MVKNFDDKVLSVELFKDICIEQGVLHSTKLIEVYTSLKEQSEVGHCILLTNHLNEKIQDILKVVYNLEKSNE